MNKLLFAALVLTFAALGAGRAEAYSHSLVNRWITPVKVRVSYLACSTDTFELKPGQTVTYRSGACCITRVTHYNQSNFVWENGVAVPAPWEHDFGLLCRNTNIAIQQTTSGHY